MKEWRLKTVLRAQPWLVIYNYSNITDRLQKISDNDMFVAYNRKSKKLEIHSVFSFFVDPQVISKNATLGQPWLNGWLVQDFLSTNNKRFKEDKEDEREYREYVLESHEERMQGLAITSGISRLQEILGRKV